MAEHIAEEKKRVSFTNLLRERSKGLLEPVARFLNGIGLMPNTVTILGLAGNTLAAVFLAFGQIVWGGIIIFLMGPVDALDGTMARLRKMPTEFGAFVDSVTDRYSELVIYGGLLYYYLIHGQWLPAMIVYLAAAGAVLVSYTRARAQSVGYDSNIGILPRLGRYLVLSVGLVFNRPFEAVVILAVLANVTALQRILDVRRKFRKQS